MTSSTIAATTAMRALTPFSLQRAAAGRALPGGAAVAVVAHGDGVAGEVAADQVGELRPRAVLRALLERERQLEHLVEVAVVHVALPVDRDQAAAHDGLEVLVAVRAVEQRHVVV